MKFEKIANGSTSDVIVLNQGYRNSVLGARWWSDISRGKSYLSIMNFQPVQQQDGGVEYVAMNFDKRVSLTLMDFAALRNNVKKVTFYIILGNNDCFRFRKSSSPTMNAETETKKGAINLINRYWHIIVALVLIMKL